MLTMKETISTYRRQFGFIPLIVLAGFCASILMYWITDQGPGVSLDSTLYIEAARSLVAGNGFFVHGKVMTHYPPGYPILIAGVDLLHPGDALQATRFLAALFFGANLVLLGLAAHICTKRSLVATSCAMLVFLSSAPTISVHSMAWSEAPFIAFSMAGFILLSQHVVRPNLRHLVLGSLMVGLAAATRYIGITIFPAVVLVLAVFSHKSLRYKIRDIILFSGVALPPLVFWLIRNMLVAQSLTNREFAFHPFSLSHVKNLIIQMYNFVLPISISGWTKAFHVGVAATLFVLAMRLLFRKTGIRQSTASIGIVLPSILVIYSALYVTFLFLSISFFDAHTPVDHRLLLPVFLALIIAYTFCRQGTL